jgi:hypothetical protein
LYNTTCADTHEIYDLAKWLKTKGIEKEVPGVDTETAAYVSEAPKAFWDICRTLRIMFNYSWNHGNKYRLNWLIQSYTHMANLMIDMLNEVDHKIDLEHGQKSALDDLNKNDDGEDDDGGDPNASKPTQPDANTETISRINRFPEAGSQVHGVSDSKEVSEDEPKRKRIISNDDASNDDASNHDDGGEPSHPPASTSHPPATNTPSAVHARITGNMNRRQAKKIIESDESE